MTDFPVTPKSDEELEREALRLRRLLGMSVSERIGNIVELLRRLAHMPNTPFHGVSIVGWSEEKMNLVDPDAEAFVEFTPLRLVARQRTLDGAAVGAPRDVMTIAHEIMHIWHTHKGARKFRTKPKEDTSSFIKAFQSAERQASYSAAAFLMPMQEVLLCSTADTVRERFGVSRQAAEIRFEQSRIFAPRTTPTQVLEFLATRRATQRPTSTTIQARPPSSVEQEVWNRASYAPGHEPTTHRLCAKGRLVRRDHHLNQRSAFGWCARDGLVRSYVDLLNLGLGEYQASNHADTPCPNCGCFSVRRTAGFSKCELCGATSGGSLNL